MKTLYGVQLGNYLYNNVTKEIVRVNTMTKKKIGYLNPKEPGVERFSYLPDISGIILTKETLDKYPEAIEEYKSQGHGEGFYVVPVETGNLYEVTYFHELQNILELHGHRIEWKL